jgi:ATP-dependent Zn protease
MNRVQRNPTPSALEATAIHEAGHAVAAWLLRVRVNSATIIPHSGALGHVTHANPLRGVDLEWDDSDRARLRAERYIKVCLAGPLAQKKFNPRSYRHWQWRE